VGGLGQCPGALQASFGPSTEPRFKAHDDHPLALQLEGAVGLGHQHLDDGAGTSVAEQALTDEELAIAQAKENLERQDLSYIERALLARQLEERQFDRAMIWVPLG
jgi:hypothetical protein